MDYHPLLWEGSVYPEYKGFEHQVQALEDQGRIWRELPKIPAERQANFKKAAKKR